MLMAHPQMIFFHAALQYQASFSHAIRASLVKITFRHPINTKKQLFPISQVINIMWLEQMTISLAISGHDQMHHGRQRGIMGDKDMHYG